MLLATYTRTRLRIIEFLFPFCAVNFKKNLKAALSFPAVWWKYRQLEKIWFQQQLKKCRILKKFKGKSSKWNQLWLWHRKTTIFCQWNCETDEHVAKIYIWLDTCSAALSANNVYLKILIASTFWSWLTDSIAIIFYGVKLVCSVIVKDTKSPTPRAIS